MKDLIRVFETIWISVAFAEAGEQKTARELMGPVLGDTESAETCHAV